MYEQIKLKQFQTQELQKKKFTKRSRNIDGSFSADISENGKGNYSLNQELATQLQNKMEKKTCTS